MSRPLERDFVSGGVLCRAPVANLARLHQIVLPTPWDIGPVQIYLIEGDPLTLIDTGVRSPESRAGLGRAFGMLGIGLDEVRRVVLTHWHTDHMGQVQTLREAGAELECWIHEADAPHVEHFSTEREADLQATNALFGEYGVPADLLARQTEWRKRAIQEGPALADATRVDRALLGGERISFKDFELEVIHAPGHSAGHILLYEDASGTLLTGDHLMGAAVPFTENFYIEGTPDPKDPLRRRPRFRGLPAYLRSLKQLRGGSYRTILPAHGGIIERPGRAIDEALLFYEVRVQRAERALARLLRGRDAVNGWELWQALFPKADPVAQMRTRMLMVIGILDVLEWAGRIVPERGKDGVLRYTLP